MEDFIEEEDDIDFLPIVLPQLEQPSEPTLPTLWLRFWASWHPQRWWWSPLRERGVAGQPLPEISEATTMMVSFAPREEVMTTAAKPIYQTPPATKSTPDLTISFL